ncbi:MAG: RagB/SusD protein [Mucilaginibacter sp.]|nr:RagB/SusD protein [Mucilaginibacter sp.]
MKTKYLLYSITLCMGTFSLLSCKKQIEIGPPITKIVTSNVFSSDGTATAAQLSIYAQTVSAVPYSLHRVTALSSDELLTFASDRTSIDLYTNSLSAAIDGPANILPFWTPFYNYIYQENAILENLKISGSVTPKVKKQLTGEAQFMRAYFYFYLVNLYGDVPLVTTTDYTINASMGRTSKAEVYQQIVQDLTDAQSNLSTKYVDATDTMETVDRIRPTVWAADALLARTYLYLSAGYYKKAEDQASLVIGNSTAYSLPADLNTVFKKNSSEAIWQLSQQNSSSVNSFFTVEGGFFNLIAAPSSSTSNSSTISSQLMSAFEPGDARKINWISSYTSGSNTWSFPYKYKDNAKATVTTEYTMMLRLAEQYLIRSEARAQQGNISGAAADLNIIRNRAGLPNYNGAMDQNSLIVAISHERQVELFTEGDRWLNLKRTGTVDAVMGGPTGITAAKGGSWNSYQQLYPINITDIQKNSKLVQNPGY